MVVLRGLLARRIKYSRVLYGLYYWVGSLAINVLKFFVRPQDNLVLFISFGGKQYDDSPRVIYEGLLRDPRFDHLELVWAFDDPNRYEVPRGIKVKTDTLRYFIYALKARIWITNSSVERGLAFKGKKTFYINTWHGSPIKTMGTDIPEGSRSFRSKAKFSADLITAQSSYDVDVFSRVFQIDRARFVVCGLPRNDVLVHGGSKQSEMKARLGIPSEKKVILYAPTYREFELDEASSRIMSLPPVDFGMWERELGKDYVVLFRAHYEVAERLKLDGSDFVRDVTRYPVLSDLMIASDILISDYSSIFFDYSILNKPMLCFAYDYDIYLEKRGLYFDVRNLLPGGSIDEKKLVELIKNLDYDEAIAKTKAFREKYVETYGNATTAVLSIIADVLNC